MLLHTTITALGETFTATVDTEKIDRNYNDEEYAYWIIEHLGHYYEVNIWKQNGVFTNKGKAYAFDNIGKFEEAGNPDDECELVFNI